MITRAEIDGQPYTFDTLRDSRNVIDEGGEAIIMRLDPTCGFSRKYSKRQPFAVKLYFREGRTNEETRHYRAALARRQHTLRAFPRGLPQNVVQPIEFVYELGTNYIIGFVMPLLTDVTPLSQYMKASFRRERGITPARIVKILLNVHNLLSAVHDANVVLGDFNDKNILVDRNDQVFLVDVDSALWGQWLGLGIAATPEFTDPLLLDDEFNLKPRAWYSKESDWYSYAVIVFQLLTLTHPYKDGVHRPVQNPGKAIVPRQYFPDRVTTRLSVFDPTVHLGTGVHRPASLPEELGRLMRDIFVYDQRVAPFPLELLHSFRWMACPKCGREHGRAICPNRKCGAQGFGSPQTAAGRATVPPRTAAAPPPPPPPPPTAARPRRIYVASAANGGLVLHHGGAYRRENGTEVWKVPHDDKLSVLLAGERTVFASGNTFAVHNGGNGCAQQRTTQAPLGKTAVTTNSRHVYWITGGTLVRDDPKTDTIAMGSVTPNLTSVWAGERFGVAFTRAGILNRVHTFGATRPGFRGTYYLPPSMDDVVAAHCVLSDTHAWLMVTYRSQVGHTNKVVYVFDANAQLQATAAAPKGSNTWLGTGIASALAVEENLLVPVPRTGIVRVRVRAGAVQNGGVYRAVAGKITDDRATVGLCLTERGLVHIGRHDISPVITP